jgi:hypothetical protein
MIQSLRASLGFALVVLVILGLFGFLGVVLVQPGLVAGLLGQETAGHISGHFRDYPHRIHDLTFGFLFGTAMVGLLAQLRSPSENVAGQLMALVPWAGLLLAFTLSRFWDLGGGVAFPLVASVVFGGLISIATILHPTQRALFRSFSVSRVNRLMLALVIIASVPLVAFAFTNIDRQRNVTDPHSVMGHYAFMAAFSFTVIGVGLLASLRPDGWWLPAWVTGGLSILLGLTSLVYPDVSSSLSLPWSLAAIAWGVGFVVAAELTQDAAHPTLLGSRGVIAKKWSGA